MKKLLVILLIVGATMSSCMKQDLDDIRRDMEAQTSQIATLDAALKAGKIVTNITSVTNGHEITFNDNSKITVSKNATI